MAKSLKSLLSKINLVDLVVVLVLVAVMICLMKKMNVVEGLCGLSRAGQEKILSGSSTKTQQEMAVSCSLYDDSECRGSIIEDEVEMCSTDNVASWLTLQLLISPSNPLTSPAEKYIPMNVAQPRLRQC